MESNGKPNKIQLSNDANHFLTKVVGGYITQSRGEVIIKGKGVMETFWLIGLENDVQTQREFYNREVIEQAKSKTKKPEPQDDELSIDSLGDK
ncbi:hypothetical protein FO519_009421 [Halicephalobus sp. NKZ332]|nr:hypothetical protein FO519_009421 [Halicephalobus sp. NKZ332]